MLRGEIGSEVEERVRCVVITGGDALPVLSGDGEREVNRPSSSGLSAVYGNSRTSSPVSTSCTYTEPRVPAIAISCREPPPLYLPSIVCS